MNFFGFLETIKFRTIVGGTICLLVAQTSGVHAQALEEVIVTATMRSESIQDVPLSISAVSSDDIESIGAYRFEDVSALVPNFEITEGAITNIVAIRGIQSGGNQGFEQSVGLFRDGIYTGRSQLSRLPFLDVEMIEVIRGPQGVLFGKSTIAGAVSQRSASPSQEFEIGARTQLAIDDDQDVLVEGFVSGPLSDNVRGRLAARYRDSDGYILNEALGDGFPEREEFAVRGTLQWDISDDVLLTAKAEHSDWQDNGRPFEIYYIPPGSTYDGLIDGTLNGVTSITNTPDRGGPGGTDAGALDDFAGFAGSDREFPFSDADAQLFSMKLEAPIGAYTLESVTGYAAYSFSSHIDGDFTAFPFLTNVQQEEYSQFSQEFRILSPADGAASWVVGLYYETNEFEFDEQIDVVPLNAEKFVTDFDQDEENLSAFAQLTYSFTDQLHVTGGLRYTKTDKDAEQSQLLAPILPIGNLDTITGFSLLGAVFGIANHTNIGSSSEGRTDWSFNLEYDFGESGDHSSYLTISQGSKAGGFDARATQTIDQGTPGQLGSFEFLEEQAVTYEIGLKSLWLDSTLQWNLGLYQTEFDDLQESQFSGGLTFQVQNAPSVTVKGIESDLLFRATENLELYANLGFVDFEFESFPCSPAEEAATPPGSVCVSPRLGKNPEVPEWTGSTGFRYERSISNRVSLWSSGTLTYRDSLFGDSLGLAATAQSSLTQIDAQIGIADSDGRWSIGLLGKNLTDETGCNFFGNVPVSQGARYCIANRARTVYLQASTSF